MATSAKKKNAGVRRRLRHRDLIALEAVLLVGLIKDWVAAFVKTSNLPNYAKVLFIMAATIGLLGGLFLVVEKLTRRGVAHAHQAVRSLPVPLPIWLVHAAMLVAFFLLYARALNLNVL